MVRSENVMELDEKSNVAKATLRRLGELDWDFPAQASDSPFSSLHWHPCRFPSQIPAISIARLTAQSDIVLDPFMGSATTIVEAQRLGRKAVGIDVNPISTIIARAKTSVIDAGEIEKFVNSACLLIASQWDDLPIAEAPPSVQLAKWYTNKTALGLCKLWMVVNSSEEHFKPIIQAAFSSILLAACREIRHWGYICDNSEPKSEREADVASLFCSSLRRFSEAYRQRDGVSFHSKSIVEIYTGPSQEILQQFPDEYFDCVVTSPPYFGVADYVKAQRLSMEWFALDIEPIRQKEIGARSKRHRKTSLTEYVNDLKSVLFQTHRVMKRNASAVIIFGQSPSRANSYHGFSEALLDVGFTIELERIRQIPKTRRQKPSLLEEIVIIARK